MAAAQGELAPEDNAELLSRMSEARRLHRRDDERGWQRAKRDLVLEMLGHPLLIAVEDATPATRPGPAATRVRRHAAQCRSSRAPRRRRRARASDQSWLERDARAAERRRVVELTTDMNAALNDGDDDRLEALRPQVPERNRMGSLLWAAEGQVISGRWRLRQSQMRLGTLQLLQAGVSFGRFADPYRGTRARRRFPRPGRPRSG